MTHNDYESRIGAAALMWPYCLIAAHIEALGERIQHPTPILGAAYGGLDVRMHWTEQF